MKAVPYIDYKILNKEFYTIPEVCNLFEMSKAEMKTACDKYNVKIRRNEIGEWGLVKYDVRKLHNFLYYESKEQSVQEDDPWA